MIFFPCNFNKIEIVERVIEGQTVSIKYESKKSADVNKLVTKISYVQSTAAKYYVKAKALFLQEMYREAIPHFLSCIMIERQNIKAYLELAEAYRCLDEFEKSVDVLERAKAIAPENPQVYLYLGISYNLAQVHSLAIENLQKSINLDSNNPNAKLQLAIAHELCEEYEMALKIYESIIDVHQDFIPALQNEAALLLELNMFNEAAGCFYRILKINPDFYRAYLGIGICFDNLQMYNKALRYYRKFLQKKPKSKTAPDIMSRIAKIKNAMQSKPTSHIALC